MWIPLAGFVRGVLELAQKNRHAKFYIDQLLPEKRFLETNLDFNPVQPHIVSLAGLLSAPYAHGCGHFSRAWIHMHQGKQTQRPPGAVVHCSKCLKNWTDNWTQLNRTVSKGLIEIDMRKPRHAPKAQRYTLSKAVKQSILEMLSRDLVN